MASIQARILTGVLRLTSAYRKRSSSLPRSTSVLGARVFARLLTVPQPPKTRTLAANIPGVDAVWHVGEAVRDDIRLVYFHGGGYCSGSSRTHRHFTAMLARRTGIPVLSVNYRLAPEHPFPAASDDANVAYTWAKHNGPSGPSDASTLLIGGDSAGGGLALSLAMQLRDAGTLHNGGLLLVSPWVDVSCSTESYTRIGHLDPMLSGEFARRLGTWYVGNHDVHDARISPLNGQFSDLPPMFVSIGGREVFLDEGLKLIEKSRRAGGEVTVERNEEMFHVWPLFFHLLPEGRDSFRRIVAWLDGRFPKQ